MAQAKTALVTGGTSGIGRSLLPTLVDAGFVVHFIGRDATRGRQIEAEHGSAVRFEALDLSDLGAVDAFARRFREEVPRLDLLANVAGVILPTRQVTAEGFETTFAVGYLAPFVLCRELRPSLASAPAARICNVSGRPGFVLSQRLDFDDLGFEKASSRFDAAIGTVHAKTVLTEILAERLRDDGITVNAFHPGAVRGDLGRSLGFPLRQLLSLASPLLPRTSTSAIYVTTSPELEGVTGQFFVGRKGQTLSFDRAYKDALWTRTLEMLQGTSKLTK